MVPADKSFLILQLRPEDATSDNEYQAILKHGGLAEHETSRLRIEKSGIPPIDLDKHCAIIVGGSPFDISTPQADKSPIQIQIENDFRKLFDRIVPADFPFLGCCSGNGLLGHYLGAPITRTHSEPVGGADIALTAEGKNDPLLTGLPERFRVLVGHKEACEFTPPGAVLLASGAVCPVQMFRIRSNVYATQFHPEGDSEGFIIRIHTYNNHGYFKAEEAQDLIERVECEQTPHAQTILKRFVNRFRVAGPESENERGLPGSVTA